jgi:hypothetical protein
VHIANKERAKNDAPAKNKGDFPSLFFAPNVDVYDRKHIKTAIAKDSTKKLEIA